MKKIITFLAIALFVPASLSAQKMTLRDCMEYTLSNSEDIRIARADVSDDRLARRSAVLAMFTPNVNAESYGYFRFGRSVDPETNTYKTTTSFNNGYGVSAGITLFDGFEALNNMRIAKTSVQMGLSEEQQVRDKICLAVMEAYYNVVYYSKLESAVASQVETAEGSFHLAERQEELGAKGHADVVQMKADLADRKYQLVSVRNTLENALLTLKDLMLFPMNEELAIDVDFADNVDFPLIDEVASASEMVARASEFNPSVIIAKGNLDNAKLNLMTSKWQLLPSLGLYGGWSTSYYTYPGQRDYVATPYGGQLKNNMGEYVQLSLSIPIYSRLSRQTKISKNKNAYERAQASYDKSLRQLETEVNRAVQERDGAAAAFEQAVSREEVQEESWHLNARRMEQGLISPLEYRTAGDNWLNAKAERLGSMLKYLLKDSVVKYYSGTSYIDQIIN